MKSFAFIALVLFFLFLTSVGVSASIVKIDKNGGVTVNILAFQNIQDGNELLSIKDVLSDDTNPQKDVLIKKEDGSIKMRVIADNKVKNLDVSGVTSDLVEIEERPQSQRIFISTDGDVFFLRQGIFVAKTEYEIRIDPESSKLSLRTPSGYKFLNVYPKDAYQNLFRAGLVNDDADFEMKISEDQNGNFSYEISGNKVFNIFDLFEYKFPMTVVESAENGKIIDITNPTWLSFLKILYN